jgi:hypothetical protein
MLPWMKREGSILWFCLLAIAVLEFLRRRNFRTALLAPLPGLTACIGWKIVTHICKAPPSADFLPLTIGTVHANIGRLPPILREVGHELVNTQNWSLLWIAFAIALPCLAIRGRWKLSAQLFLSIAVPLGFYSCIYILSSWPYYMNHIQVSLPRLVIHVAPVALLAIGLAFDESQKRNA